MRNGALVGGLRVRQEIHRGSTALRNLDASANDVRLAANHRLIWCGKNA